VSVRPIVGTGVFELCVFNPYKRPEFVGYFDSAEAADKCIADNQNVDVYITPQELNPSLIQRGHNKLVRANERATDEQVTGYRYLLIDLDPLQRLGDKVVKRPPGVSSTDEEHEAAISLAKEIVRGICLKDENYLLIDSGNGAHIYIPVEPGVREPAIKSAVEGIKTLYETELVEVDPVVSNPSRLMRAPGSINNKGTAKRPCTYLHCPDVAMPVSYAFVAELKVETVQEPSRKAGEDLAEIVACKLGVRVRKPGPRYVLEECPFCHSTDKAAVVGRVGTNGGYYFKCHHKRCANKKWSDVKAVVGLATGRLEMVKKTLKEQGRAALEIPEVQAEIGKLKAVGDLPKLADTAREVGIEYKALVAAARKPFAIAQDLADAWIREYHIKSDKLTRTIYCYQDGVYVDAEDVVAGLIDERFRGLNTISFMSNVLEYVRRHSAYEFTDEWLAVNNGLLNPETLEIVGFTPEIVTRIRLNVIYDAAAQCPTWLKFLGECESNPTLLQEAAGYPLLPEYPYQKAIMLLGAGGQGKSVFLRVVCDILSAENVSSATLQTLIENRFATSDLYGRLANISGDIPDMALSNTGVFKALTGDDRIRAECKGQDAFEFMNRAKLIFSANQLPPTRDKSVGYMRRWVIIDFLRQMVEHPNPRLAAELLAAERSGIFNWMLAGAKRVSGQGFTYTSDPEDLARRYVERSEPVVEFLEDCCEENFDSTVSSGAVFAAYNQWAKAKKKKRMGSKEFVAAMRDQTAYSIEYHRLGTYNSQHERPMVFGGIQMRPMEHLVRIEAY
jgi:P4 family phage/plasmid primase-like protien